LQRLLREEVPIRPLGAILEALADATERTRDVGERTEYVRRRLARNLCARYRDGQRRIRVVTVDPALQDRIAAGLTGDAEGWAVRLAPQTVQEINSWLARAVEEVTREGAAPVVLVSSEIRAALKQLTAARQPRLVVLSYDEITSDTVIESVRMVGEPLRAAA
jgi:flagellar biosynthesis protein FlhA